MTRISQLLVLLLCAQLFLPVPLCAQTVPDSGATNGTPAPADSPAAQSTNLNLSSTARTINASQVNNLGSADIRVGNHVRTVTAQDMLTAAEFVAVQQVVSSGSQSIELNGHGRATGGTFNLNAELSSMMASLAVPRGVTAIYDAASPQAFNLAGDLTNSGTLYALSSNPQVTNATLNAANIFNGERALISTVVPTTVLDGITNAVSNLNLTLTALQNIVNAGTISSAGNLTLSAGGSIVNALPAGVTGPSPVLQAMNNINLFTANLVNSGTIAAAVGNINVASQMAQNIAINNVGGQLQALAGAINVRDALFGSKFDLTMLGGDFLANQLNLYSGTGHVLADVNSISGVTNVYGHEAHITTTSGTFSVGTIALTGDPVFANKTGDLLIVGDLTFPGQDLAFLAGGSISANANNILISTAGDTTNPNGGKIVMVAGANFGAAGTGGTTGDDTGDGANTTAGDTYIILPGAGGNITLGNGTSNARLDTRGSTGNGGLVTLVAYASGLTGGAISIGDITTGGAAGAGNGDVLMIGGTTNSTISFSNINTTGGNSAGAVSVLNRTPSSPVTLTIDPGGSTFTLTGSFTPGTIPATGTSAINLGTVNAASTITIQALANIISGGGRLTAPAVSLTSTVGNIGATGAGAILTNVGVGALTVSAAGAAAGNAFVSELDDVNLGLSTVRATYSLTTPGHVSVENNVTATGASGLISINAGGNITNTTGSHALDALRVELVSTGGNIGVSAANRLRTNAGAGLGAHLTVNATATSAGNGNAYISDLNAANINTSVVDKELNITTSPGALNVIGNITSNNLSSGSVTLSAAGSGNLTLAGNVTVTNTASGSISLSAAGGNGITRTSGTLSARDINLSATAGSIGTSAAQRVVVNATNLTANASAANQSVFVSEIDSVELLGNSSAGAVGGTFNLLAGNNITNDSGPSDTITASSVVLAATAGSIGSADAVNISTPSFTANASAGNVAINAAGSTNIAGASTALGSFAVTAANNLTSSSAGTVNAGAVHLTAAGGSLALAGAITGATSVSLTSGSNLNNGAFATVNTQTLNLTSTAGSIGSTGALNINVANFSANAATGSVAINAAGSTNISGASAAVSTFTVTAATNLNSFAAGTVSANIVDLTATSGLFALPGTINGTTSVSLRAGSNIDNGAFATINTPTLNLTSTGGSIGSSSALDINAANFSANAGTGSVAINAAASTNISGASAAVGTFAVTAAADLTSSSAGTVNAGAVSLTSSAGTLNLAGAVTGTTGVSLTASAGNLIINTSVSATGGNVALISGSGATNSVSVGASALVQATAAGATISINTANLVNAGSVSAAGLLSIQSNNSLSVSGSGSLAGATVSVVSGGGSVSVSNGSIAGSVTGSAAGGFSVNVAAGGLTAGSITASNGSLDLFVGSGALAVNALAVLSANEGDLTLQNSDTVNGSISIGGGASLTAFTTGTTLGRMNIVIGPVPATPVPGSTPANFVVNLTNGGQIFFGTNGVTAQPPDNIANVNGSVVILDTGSLPAGAINFGGGVTLNATASNPNQVTLIDSLDLTSAPVISLLLSLQDTDQVGGQLIVVEGMVTGGNLIVDPSDLASSLSAANIVENVTLTFAGFQSANVVGISLTENSTTSQVIFSGIQEFVGTDSASNGAISITSTQAGPLLVISSSGLLRSDGSLSVSTAGDMLINGQVTANHLLLQTTANNGNITLGAAVTGTTSANLAANGSGNIIQNAGSIVGQLVSLSSGTGNIGTQYGKVSTIAQNLTANTGGTGNVYICNIGGVSVGASSAGNVFSLKAFGALSVIGNITGNEIDLKTAEGSHNISLAANVQANSVANLAAKGAGSITQSAGMISGATVHLRSGRGNIGNNGLPINTQAIDLSATTGGRGKVSVSDVDSLNLLSSRSGGDFRVAAGGNLTVSDIEAPHGSISAIAGNGALTVAPHSLLSTEEGNITLQNLDTTNGSILIGQGSVISAFTLGTPGVGNVRIVIGPIPEVPVRGTRPANTVVVQAFGGRVFFGANSITAQAPTNLLLALGRNIIFNTGERPSTAITLGGSVTIIADPPPPALAQPATVRSSNPPIPAPGQNAVVPAIASNMAAWNLHHVSSMVSSTHPRNNLALSVALPTCCAPSSSSFGYTRKNLAARGVAPLSSRDFHEQPALNVATPLTSASPRNKMATRAGAPFGSASPQNKIATRAWAPRNSASPRNKLATRARAPLSSASPRNRVATRAEAPLSSPFSRMQGLILEVLSRAGWPLNNAPPHKNLASRQGTPLKGAPSHKKLAARPGATLNRASARKKLAARPGATLSRTSSPKKVAARAGAPLNSASPWEKLATHTGTPLESRHLNERVLAQELVLALSLTAPRSDQELANGSTIPGSDRVNTGNGALDIGSLSPIAFTYPTAAAVVDSHGLDLLMTGSALVRYSGGTKIADAAPATLCLEEGEALISARKDTEVKSGSVKVTVGADSDVLMERNAGVLIVRNLHERGLDSVRISIDDKYTMSLAAGQEIMIGPDDLSLDKQRKHDAIGRRGWKHGGLTSGNSLATCEVSLVSLVGRSNLMSTIMRSRENSDCEIIERIVKMAACLHLTTQTRGAYASGASSLSPRNQ